jgi:uncharacterized protein (TIGR00369 family)
VADAAPDTAELMREFFAHSPFGQELGLELVKIAPDEAEVLMPFAAALATYGDVIHGGAIAALLDVAATAAAWSGAKDATEHRGATAGMAVTYLRAAHGADLRARARVARRGRSLCFIEVEAGPADAEPVAKALVTYKLGG